MKKLALQVAALSLALAGTASAADLRRPMPVRRPRPWRVAAYSWTGCYVGAGGGYGMCDQESQPLPATAWCVGQPVTMAAAAGSARCRSAATIRSPPNIVIGAFGDYDWSGIKGDILRIRSFAWVGEEKLKNSWAAGGRIGWVPWSTSQLMVYVSGGYTQAKFGG